MRLCLFIPKHPEGTEYFLPLLSPLVVVGSLSNHIKVNGPQRHTVSQHGEPVLVQSGLSGDQSCSYSIKIWWLSICSWRLFWTACVLSSALPPWGEAGDRFGQLWSFSVYSNISLWKCSPRLFCLDVMVVQERRCFPHGHSWGLRLSKNLPTVVLHLIIQDGWSTVGLCEICFLLGTGDKLETTKWWMSAPEEDGITVICCNLLFSQLKL